jgi:hypothetical protein
MRPVKMMLNDYPEHGADISIFDFMMDRDAGLPKIIEFLEVWQRELPRVRQSMVLRYEDMRADPESALGRALSFLGTPGTEQQIREAAAYASYDNMKQLEQQQVYRLSGARLAPGDQANPQSYKVRRAKVGGWRDYFDDQQVAAIDALLASGKPAHTASGEEGHGSHRSARVRDRRRVRGQAGVDRRFPRGGDRRCQRLGRERARLPAVRRHGA